MTELKSALTVINRTKKRWIDNGLSYREVVALNKFNKNLKKAKSRKKRKRIVLRIINS